MNIKDELCIGCALYDCRGPVHTEFAAEHPDVLFVGEAPGATEIEKKRPMIGQAGQILRNTLEYLGNSCPSLKNFAIANVWRCRPPGNILPEGVIPGEYCQKLLREDILRGQKIIVPLGGTALTALMPNMDSGLSITHVQGLFFSTVFDGNQRTLQAMLHPSYINRRGSEWRSWELGFDKLVLFLNTGKTRYIPQEERIVHQAEDVQQTLSLIHMVKELSATYKRLDCDIETTPGLDPWTGEAIPDVGVSMPWAGSRIISMSIAWKPTESIAFMWKDVNETSLQLLKSMFEDTSISWGWYNGQFDTQHVYSKGITPRIDRDGQLAMHEVDERNGVHALKRDSRYILESPDWEGEIKQYAPTKGDSYENIPKQKLLRYNGLDTCHTNHLEEVAREYMKLEGSLWHYENILCPGYNMLARSRYVGMRIDIRRAKELQSKILPVMEELTQQMCTLSDNRYFNPNSYRDKLDALHKRGIMVESSNRETLAAYEGDELVDLISAYMQASKMESTYLRGFVDDVFKDMRVHPNWKLPAENGRMRAENPPVLTLPRKAEVAEHLWKRYMKEIFIADPGTTMFQVDRKQSEVRCVVFIANDREFIKQLKNDPRSDIHGEFTKMLYGAGYTKEQRVYVKMVVFGLIYNREAPSLALQLCAIERDGAKKKAVKAGIDWHTLKAGTDYKVWSVRDAQKFINAFFERMPTVLVYKKETIKTGMKQGFLQNYFGLMRRWGIINQLTKVHAQNEMVNFPVSSMSNDINLVSCAETMKQFGKYGVEVLVPVHDSGLMQIPKDSLYIKDDIKAMWEALPAKLLRQRPYEELGLDPDVPFPVDESEGERWSDL